MSTQLPQEPGSPSHQESADLAVRPQTLRWWPAAVILGMMLLLKIVPRLVESPPLPVLMVGFMGPAAAAILLLVWWLFASRAGGREKLIGLLGLIAIIAATMLTSDPSIQGMGVFVYQTPVGFAAFALPLVLLAGQPRYRLGLALIGALLGFGFWDLVRMEGTRGDFRGEFAWRWSPTAEEEYLKALAAQPSGTIVNSNAPTEAVRRADAEWPDFRGKDRRGVVEGICLSDDWAQTPPRLVWKKRVGPGWSSFTVAGERLFTQEQRGEMEAVVCLSAATGDVLWAHEYPARFSEVIGGPGPRATPTIGDDVLYSLGADGHLTALRPADGTVLWQRELRADADRQPPQWGWAGSPLVLDGLVIVHGGGEGNKGVLAYQADTGELVWSVPSGDHGYSSPQPARFAETDGVLVMSNWGLQFLNPRTGETIWSHEWSLSNYRAIQPLVIGNSVLIATSLGAGTRKITVARDGDAWQITVDWTSRDMKPEFNDFVAFDGYLYGFDGSIFACVDLATGKRRWKQGRYGNGQVLLLSDSGQLLVSGETGEIHLLRASPDKLTELASFPAIAGKTWNHPVLVNDRLYLRNGEEAACYELPLAAAP